MKALLFALAVFLGLASHAEAQVTKVNLLMSPTGPPSYSGPGDIIAYTSFVSAARAYTGALAGTQKLVNVTSAHLSDTCDIISLSAGGTGLTVAGGGCTHIGDSGVTFCNSSTDCTLNIAYQQVVGGAQNPGNYIPDIAPVYWDPIGYNSNRACFSYIGSHRIKTTNSITASGEVSLSAVFNQSTSVTSIFDYIIAEVNTSPYNIINTSSTLGIQMQADTYMNVAETFPGLFAVNGVIHGASSSLNVNGSLASVVTLTGGTGTNTGFLGYNLGSSDATCTTEAGYIDAVDFGTSETALYANQKAFYGGLP